LAGGRFVPMVRSSDASRKDDLRIPHAAEVYRVNQEKEASRREVLVSHGI